MIFVQYPVVISLFLKRVKWPLMTVNMVVTPPLGHEEHKLVCEENREHGGAGKKTATQNFWYHETSTNTCEVTFGFLGSTRGNHED